MSEWTMEVVVKVKGPLHILLYSFLMPNLDVPCKVSSVFSFFECTNRRSSGRVLQLDTEQHKHTFQANCT